MESETSATVNLETNLSELNKDISEPNDTLTVAITGASGNVAYSLCFMIAQGLMFGERQKVSLHLI